jgi:hypothetical protein
MTLFQTIHRPIVSRRIRSLICWLSPVALAISACPVQASKVLKIRCPESGIVAVSATYNSGASAFAKECADNGIGDEDPRPGYFQFTPPRKGDIDKAEAVCTGRFLWTAFGVSIASMDFGAAGMDAYPPMDVPLLSDANTGATLVAQVNMAALLTSGNPFVPGTTFQVIDGVASESAAIVFRDASSLGTNEYALAQAMTDDATVDSLPLFTGTVGVHDPINLAPVPEPAAACVLVGAAALFAHCRRW